MKDVRQLTDAQLIKEIEKEAQKTVSPKEKSFIANVFSNMFDVSKADAKALASAGLTAASLMPMGRLLKGAQFIAKNPMMVNALGRVLPHTFKGAINTTVGTIAGTHLSNKALQGVEDPNWKDYLAATAIGHGGQAALSKGLSTGVAAAKNLWGPKANLGTKEKIISDALKAKRTREKEAWTKYGKPKEAALTKNRVEIDLGDLYSDLAKRTEGYSEKALDSFKRSPEGKAYGLFEGKSSPHVEHSEIKQHLKDLKRAAKTEHAFEPSASESGHALAHDRRLVKAAQEKAVLEHLGAPSASVYKKAKRRYSEYKKTYAPHIEDILKHEGNRGEVLKAALKGAKDGAYVPERVLSLIKDPKEKAIFAREVIKEFPGLFENAVVSLNPSRNVIPIIKNLHKDPEFRKIFYKAAKPHKSRATFGPPLLAKDVDPIRNMSDEELLQALLEEARQQRADGGGVRQPLFIGKIVRALKARLRSKPPAKLKKYNVTTNNDDDLNSTEDSLFKLGSSKKQNLADIMENPPPGAADNNFDDYTAENPAEIKSIRSDGSRKSQRPTYNIEDIDPRYNDSDSSIQSEEDETEPEEKSGFVKDKDIVMVDGTPYSPAYKDWLATKEQREAEQRERNAMAIELDLARSWAKGLNPVNGLPLKRRDSGPELKLPMELARDPNNVLADAPRRSIFFNPNSGKEVPRPEWEPRTPAPNQHWLWRYLGMPKKKNPPK